MNDINYNQYVNENTIDNQSSRSLIYWYTTHRTNPLGEKLKEYFDIIDHFEFHPPVFSFGILGRFLKRYLYFRRRKPEAIVVDSFGREVLVLAIQAKLQGIPLVMRLRGGMWGEFSDEACTQGWRSALNRTILTKTRDRVLKLAALIIPVSVFGKTQVLYEFPGIDPSKIHVVYRPVEMDRFSEDMKRRYRDLLKIHEDSHLLLAVTNFNYHGKYKALYYYHDSLVKFLKEHPDWVYVIAGGGHDLERFKNEIDSKTPEELKERVNVAGYHPHIEEALMDSDIVLSLSFRDMGPQIVKEALAAGKPVVVNSSAGGAAEFIPEHSEGPSMIIDEPTELYDTLKMLASDEALRLNMGESNRTFVEDRYSFETGVERFVSAITSISEKET